MTIDKTQDFKVCEVCGAVGDIERVGCAFLNRRPKQRSPCQKIKERLSRPVCAARKIRSLKLPRVDIPYSLTAAGIDKNESDQTVVEKLSKKFSETVSGRVGSFNINLTDLHYVDEVEVKKILSKIFFYDYHKFNRMEKRGDDRDEKFFDACAVIYSACGIELNGHKGVYPLKSLCLNALKKVQSSWNSTSTKLPPDVTTEEDGSQKPAALGHRNVKPTVRSSGSVQEQGLSLQLPVSLVAEMKGVVFLHGKDVAIDQNSECHELDGDELLIAINHPCGMAFGFYCYYDGLYI